MDIRGFICRSLNLSPHYPHFQHPQISKTHSFVAKKHTITNVYILNPA